MKDFLKKDIAEYKYIPTSLWDRKCFACGKDNPEGLFMEFFTDEKHLFSQILIPETKRGWDQVVHGGILSTMLDEVMAWTAIYFTDCIMMTKSLTVNYIKPIYINEKTLTVGWVHEQKDQREIIMKGEVYNEKKQLCTEATGVYSLFSIKLALKLKLMDNKGLAGFKKFKKAIGEDPYS